MTRLVGLLLLCLAVLPAAAAFDPGRVGFALRVNEEIIPYFVFAVFVLPSEPLELEIVDGGTKIAVASETVRSRRIRPSLWRAAAPERPGVYEVFVTNGAAEMRLNVVVMHSAAALSNGRLRNFRVGAYPAEPLNGDPVYLAPKGFVELDARTESLELSPHFRLSQFPSKQAGSYPKYLVIRERLILKLEVLLEHVNEQGIEAHTFTVMSGYRTPFYNAAIGNVPYSRHVYGGAADIFIDVAPRDGIMDDLNGDGRNNYRDAQVLYLWANALFGREEHRRYVGGLGVYKSTPAHGPFLHVDARGRDARWGLIP